MSSDINAILQLEKEYVSSRIIVAKEINGCDSTFIISSVLGHCIKNKNAVLIVSTHYPLSHYQNIGLKMNYNIQKAIDSGLIVFYNLGAEWTNIMLKKETCELQHILASIKEKFSILKKQFHSVNIILDGLSHLFDMQYRIKDVNIFSKEVISLIEDGKNSFVLFHVYVACEEDVTHTMANLLVHKAHIALDVANLPSGWSADVSGHLTIRYIGRKFEDENKFIMDNKPSKYLFKLFDRGVKLFAPGTV